MSGNDGTSGCSKVLGMWWSTTDDAFYYKINTSRLDPDMVKGSRVPTKREILRVVMMLYDPLGLIAPFIVYAKILLRDVWRSKTDWDEPIKDVLVSRWTKWSNMLTLLENIRIPRCYSGKGYDSIQLHTFVDASEHAFAAVSYFRIVCGGEVFCRLIGAKTRVAPQQVMSIPRLELQGAVLGSRLAKSLCQAHNLQPMSRVFWSDSTDVLAWLTNEEKRYRQFIAFRVGEILSITNKNEWRWVPTQHNVADEGTKWKPAPDLSHNSRWQNGPEFLKYDEKSWPIQKIQKISPSDEEISQVCVHDVHVNEDASSLVPDHTRFSRWCRLRRTTAWILRFFYLAKGIFCGSLAMTRGELTCAELNRADEELYRMIQRDAYHTEIHYLKEDPSRPLQKTDRLYKLTPFLDESKILRLRGRARYIEGVPYDVINPIILPHDHVVTNMIITAYHEKYHHSNHETTINEIRQKFAIVRLRSLLRKVRSMCQFCKNKTARPKPPLMGDHPHARLAVYTPPFSYVGIDYFGPIEVAVGRHAEKRWVVLFTCLTVRAVHLEIAYTLNKNSCLMAIRNFIARRGMPIEIRTDNGTNFKGACNEIKTLHRRLKQDDYRRQFSKINWIFNTPLAPHTGGCWEIMVKAVKRCIMTSIPTTKPSDEILRCFLMEAEAVVNSRPLTFVPINPDDEEAITPNTILLGSSNGSKSFSEFDDSVDSVVRTYEMSQKMADLFWKRWLREYLPMLTRTTKWFGTVKPIDIGDVVIIMNERERNSWKKGIVIDRIVGGRNQQVRTVTIKTNDGIYSRPASKVAVLDVKPKMVNRNDKSTRFTGGEDVANSNGTEEVNKNKKID